VSNPRHVDEIKLPSGAGKGTSVSCEGVFPKCQITRKQEAIMSFVQQSDVYRNLQKADRKHHGYSFILVLFCMALGIVVASAIFAPISVGEGINTDTWSVGP
jgi:hypothetical protein